MPPLSVLSADQYEQLLTGFATQVCEPSEAIPTTRCLSARTLRRILGALRTDPSLTWLRRFPHRDIIETLTQSSVLKPLMMEDGDSELSEQLFAVGLGITPDRLDPTEILLGLEPKGVICYFTALATHGLTTQIPPHHHIAILSNRPSSTGPSISSQKLSGGNGSPSLGTLRTRFQGAGYYSTIRSRNAVPGIERRILTDQLMIRSTTREQTLLDTLMRPVSCGGSAVVFEAWERTGADLDVARVLQLLRAINHRLLARRAGYMLASFGAATSDPTISLEGWHREFGHGEAAPLLPGMPYTRIDHRWNLQVP